MNGDRNITIGLQYDFLCHIYIVLEGYQEHVGIFLCLKISCQWLSCCCYQNVHLIESFSSCHCIVGPWPCELKRNQNLTYLAKWYFKISEADDHQDIHSIGSLTLSLGLVNLWNKIPTWKLSVLWRYQKLSHTTCFFLFLADKLRPAVASHSFPPSTPTHHLVHTWNTCFTTLGSHWVTDLFEAGPPSKWKFSA